MALPVCTTLMCFAGDLGYTVSNLKLTTLDATLKRFDRPGANECVEIRSSVPGGQADDSYANGCHLFYGT